jgi:hypothetical protein
VAKSIRDRVRASFSSEDRDSLRYYLDSLITVAKSYADGLRRSASFMIILIAVFELLLKGVIKQVTIGPFVFTGITTILAFGPSVIAYFYYESCSQSVIFGVILRTHRAAFRIWNEDAARNELDIILAPPTPAFFYSGGTPRESVSLTVGFISRAGLAFRYLFGLGPLFFEAYAFYQLFNVRHAPDVLLWLNAVPTFCFLLMGFLAIQRYGIELSSPNLTSAVDSGDEDA